MSFSHPTAAVLSITRSKTPRKTVSSSPLPVHCKTTEECPSCCIPNVDMKKGNNTYTSFKILLLLINIKNASKTDFEEIIRSQVKFSSIGMKAEKNPTQKHRKHQQCFNMLSIKKKKPNKQTQSMIQALK